MHPMIRQLASKSLRRIGIGAVAALVGLALASGCMPPEKPKVQKPPYPNLGLKPVPVYLKDTILEHTDITNTGPFAVSSYGLVVNLRHSGDAKAPPPVREWVKKEMYRHGIASKRQPGYEDITPEVILSDPRTAIVMAGAYVPPGARKGQRVDVIVQALPGSNTASLAGGLLWRSELRVRGVDPINPGGAVNKLIEAEGPIFIDPALALEIPGPAESAARSSSRIGTIIGGGIVSADRPLHLRVRTPQYAISRAIQMVINTRFGEQGVAQAQDEGTIHLNVPLQYKGNWEHFAGVVSHLYVNLTPAQAAKKAQELAEEAKKPDAWLENISYALEALGPVAVPFITPLLAHPSPDVQYAAARAGAFVGDRASEDALMAVATTAGHPFRLNAIAALGELPNNAVINGALARCLDAEEAQVRIEAYKVLAEQNDPRIFSYTVNNSYIVDEVRSGGLPMIFASRTGKPRLAIFGNRPALNVPLTFSAFDHQLTISSDPNRRNVVSIYYRGAEFQEPVRTFSGPTVVELAARLGGAGDEKLRFGYGEVVAMLQSMVDSGKVAATFVMQDLPQSADEFEDTGARDAMADPAKDAGRPVSNAANIQPNTAAGPPRGRAN